VHERRLRAGSSYGFEQVQSAGSVCVEVIEGDRCGTIVRGLSSRVYDDIRFDARDKFQESSTVPDVHAEMRIPLYIRLQQAQCPVGISVGPEEDCSLIVIDTEYLKSLAAQMQANL
jgi:hypothetical protein